jgi:hypothetical protein
MTQISPWGSYAKASLEVKDHLACRPAHRARVRHRRAGEGHGPRYGSAIRVFDAVVGGVFARPQRSCPRGPAGYGSSGDPCRLRTRHTLMGTLDG